MARITWKDGGYSSMFGCVGGLRLFSIDWKTRREDLNYLLTTDLDGFSGEKWQDNDADVLKARAEQVLEEYVHRLGAVFPDSPKEG